MSIPNKSKLTSNNYLEDIFENLTPISFKNNKGIETHPGMMMPIKERREHLKTVFLETYNPNNTSPKYDEFT